MPAESEATIRHGYNPITLPCGHERGDSTGLAAAALRGELARIWCPTCGAYVAVTPAVVF